MVPAMPPLAQPTGVLPTLRQAPLVDRRVVPASANVPQGIRFVNPAASLPAATEADGPQQAIYFEASDLSDTPAVQAGLLMPASK
jgi:hypothetical protein